jgi:glycosyltransferase involved in cell wall biosynthesis
MIDKLCLVSFSNNADHQNVIYSMYKALKETIDVYTLGIINPKSTIATFEEHNIYCHCPERPGIGRRTFRIDILIALANKIKKEKITHLYFESQHIWNAALMALCPQCQKIVAVHDVIPHDGNKAMALSNFITCQMADRIVLRNRMYKDELAKQYNVAERKIHCLDLWRSLASYTKPQYSGVFLYFGRIRKYKGLDNFIKIVASTPEIFYRVVGEPDEESKVIVNQLKQYSNVTVIDREVSDQEMIEEFEKADWLVLPYATATQSGVIVDACLHARPVIAFNVGAISEQIIEGYNGHLVAENDVSEFVSTIKKVNSYTQNELDYYSQNAYQFAKERYSASAAADEFMQIIFDVK